MYVLSIGYVETTVYGHEERESVGGYSTIIVSPFGRVSEDDMSVLDGLFCASGIDYSLE